MIVSPRHRWLLSTLVISLLSPGTSGAADPPSTTSITPRAKLERLLRCDEAKKTAILQEQRTVQTHLRTVTDFRASLTDALHHRLARETAVQAIAKDHEALTKIDERLRLAEHQIGLTLRAMKYLPTASHDESLPLIEQAKLGFADWLADRNLLSDAELDRQWEAEYGFVENAAWQQRLARIIDRLHAASPDADPLVTIRIVNRPGESGASAGRSFIYFDKGLLDRNPSDDELLFVAAHELAHVQLRHVSRGVVEAHWKGFEEDWLRKSVEGSHPAYQEGSGHDNAGWRTRMAQYIRDQEAQADLLGAQQALTAGASPRGIKDAFTHMFFDDLKRRLASDPSGYDPHYAKSLEDHARPNDRLQSLEDALGEKFWERTTLTLGSSCPH